LPGAADPLRDSCAAANRFAHEPAQTAMHDRHQELSTALVAIEDLLHDLAAFGERHADAVAAVPAEMQPSARNLAHYLAVRTRDLRGLQARLHALSLSSLGRLEGHVLGTVLGVRTALRSLASVAGNDAPPVEPLDSDDAEQRLVRHTTTLLGPRPRTRDTRIMVTLPSEAATDRELVGQLLQGGMGIARINLAHDGPAAWSAMAASVREQADALGVSCRILVDLPGPKLRTGPLPPGPGVLRLRPRRDLFGRCTRPAACRLGSADTYPSNDLPYLPVSSGLIPYCIPGDELVVVDTRGRERSLVVQSVDGTGCVATCERTVYLASGCPILLRRGITDLGHGTIGALPPLATHIALHAGDELRLSPSVTAGCEGQVQADGSVAPNRIGCTEPRLVTDAKVGDRICFDDGKVQGTVHAHDGDELCIRITGVPPGGARLRAEKGINLPDTDLQVAALTAHDQSRLDWVTAPADVVGMSFVQRPADLLQLEAELHRRNRPDMGVMLKIETAAGFQHLPELLFAGLRNPPLGVMVARGDLAVEVGYERLAEVQEEILWLCEAAHVPVVWATQVLDTMARTGVPTRAEVTDAAMGGRAECVMLNKGPYVVEATRFLASLLERMQEHTHKKRSLLRRLRVAGSPREAALQTAPESERQVDG